MTVVVTSASAARTVGMFAAVLAWLAIPPGCLRTTETRYYTLTRERPAGPPMGGTPRYTVHVAPVSVPETLDRPEIVVRRSATELTIDDGHRWAEPLRTGIARALADDLARDLEGVAVSAADEATAHESSDVEVTVVLRDLDVRLPEGAAVDIDWTAHFAGNGTTRRGRSFARAGSVHGGGYDAAVAACAAALQAASADIARCLRAETLSRR